MPRKSPLVVVIAGPNGAGKSTSASRLLQGALTVSEFVNADTLAVGLSAFHPDSAAIAAGRVMLARIKMLAASKVDFAFETTLASRSFVPWLHRLRSTGYKVHLMFLTLPDPTLAVSRVQTRVNMGGHDVPESVIRRRFFAGLRNLFSIYQSAVDSWQLFDNSRPTSPALIASRRCDGEVEITDPGSWAHIQELIR